MHEAGELATVVSEWVGKAEEDFRVALHTLKLGKSCPTGAVAFHAQQCVEKYIKAALVWTRVDFPKMHDLRRLVELLAQVNRPSISIAEQDLLTPYAVEARYPGDIPPVSLVAARRAVAITRRVREEIRAMLPAAALRKRRS